MVLLLVLFPLALSLHLFTVSLNSSSALSFGMVSKLAFETWKLWFRVFHRKYEVRSSSRFKNLF